MYSKKLTESIEKELEALKTAGKFKVERELEGAQGPEVEIAGRKVLMFASNNYLGLANHPGIVKAAKDSLGEYGFGLSSVRFISGTETIHKNLEKRIYPHGDLAALEQALEQDKDKNYRFKIIVTDGVFSMEGYLADLPKIKELAEKYEALLFVDDAHAVGVLGKTGAGTPEHFGLQGKIDVLSGTFGKALGGAVGGYIAGKKQITELLRQKSRTYMFSNSLPPSVVMASIKALDLLKEQPKLLSKVKENSDYFRNGARKLGFNVLDGEHPIVPVMLGDAALTQTMSKKLLEKGLYVVGLWFPVVPEGTARLRFQISAAHTTEQIDRALKILAEVGKEMGILK